MPSGMKRTKENILAVVSFPPHSGGSRCGGWNENGDTCDWVIRRGARFALAHSFARPSMAPGLAELL